MSAYRCSDPFLPDWTISSRKQMPSLLHPARTCFPNRDSFSHHSDCPPATRPDSLCNLSRSFSTVNLLPFLALALLFIPSCIGIGRGEYPQAGDPGDKAVELYPPFVFSFGVGVVGARSRLALMERDGVRTGWCAVATGAGVRAGLGMVGLVLSPSISLVNI